MTTDSDIQDKLREADKHWNVMDLSMAMVEMMHDDRDLTFADFERNLRAIGSKTFLIARPNSMTPAGLRVIKPFQKRPDNLKHHLWVCLHGKSEQEQELQNAGMTEADNLDALQNTCGVLAKAVNLN